MARTSAAGRIHPACACQRARWCSSSGTLAAWARCCVRASVSGQDSGAVAWGVGVAGALASATSQSAGRRRSPGAWRSSTPVAAKSTPSCSNAVARARVARAPARVRRDTGRSSGDTCGATTPAGSPDAPVAGSSAWSSTVTRQPRWARLYATDAPARPAPTTTQWPGAAACTGASGMLRRLGDQCGARVARSTLRLGGGPGTRSTTKPQVVKPSRTLAATLQVAARAPGRARRATALSTGSPHMSGLRAGSNPSR